ncbi:MAG: sulfotransferase [Bacteroidales bacterium]|nr:sulfotransferase [Bacteroidales bacterium]
MRHLQEEIAHTPVTPPIFVLGHWRTGTTLLHELLIQDPAHASPTTLHCFIPNHFLISESFFKKYLWFLIAEKRPMDNMALGWDMPQEDEFALALLGEPSPYTDIAFPNRVPIDPGSLDLSGLSPQQLRRWKRTFFRFLQAVQMRFRGQRLVLKSPPHTARIRVLLELFPDAQFVHIRRNPYELFASTNNLWLSLARKHGLQTPQHEDQIREKVFQEFRVLYDRYFSDCDQIPKQNLVEIRYEDLAADLVGETERVYDALQLPDFEAVRPQLEAFAAARKGYERNKWSLSAADHAEIQSHWGDLIEKLGYPVER